MLPLPLIGVSGSVEQDERKQLILRNYCSAILAAGGIPLLLSVDMNEEQINACLSSLEGLLLTGGWDAAPSCYGETPVPALGVVQPLRDQFELRLLHAAKRLELPVLGICRGVQMMNIFQGGSLYQDLDSQFSKPVPHQNASHNIRIEKNSRLFSILGVSELEVNSFHHQALRRLAPGVVPTAFAPDGVIEAAEDPSHPFWLGVQWHPERAPEEEVPSQCLFRAFVKAAKDFAGKTAKIPC